MKYYIVMYTEEEEVEIMDNDGWILYFSSANTAINFWKKFKSGFAYDDLADADFLIDAVNEPYTAEDAEKVINFMLEMI